MGFIKPHVQYLASLEPHSDPPNLTLFQNMDAALSKISYDPSSSSAQGSFLLCSVLNEKTPVATGV